MTARAFLSGRRAPLILFAALLCAGFAWFALRDADAVIAWRGCGPQDFVWQTVFPENFRHDWDSGLNAGYRLNVLMRAYVQSYQWFGLDPSSHMRAHIVLEIALFGAAVWFFVSALFPDRRLAFLALLAVLCNPVPGMNLGRFCNFQLYLSNPTFSSLFYGYALAFGLLASGAFLRGRLLAAAVLAALGTWCHFTLGLFCVLFIAGGAVFSGSRPGGLLRAALLYALLAFPCALGALPAGGAAMTSGQSAEWLLHNRVLSYHWFPSTVGMFDTIANLELLPCLLVFFFGFLSLRPSDLSRPAGRAAVFGSLAALALTAFGLLCAEFFPVPFLLKISFQRMSLFATFVSLLFVLRFLYANLRAGSPLRLALSSWALVCLWASVPGLPVLALLVLFFLDVRSRRAAGPFALRPASRTALLVLLASAFVFLVLNGLAFSGLVPAFLRQAAQDYTQHGWYGLRFFSFSAAFDFLLKGGQWRAGLGAPSALALASALFLALMFLRRLRGGSALRLKTVLLGLAALGLVLVQRGAELRDWRQHRAAPAFSYLSLQLWARDHTPSDAVFLNDPSFYFGWRDFSRRGSFGNLQDWGLTPFVYQPFDAARFEEGKARMALFGVVLTPETLAVPNFKSLLDRTARDRFYAMTEEDFLALAARYRIDYVVLRLGPGFHTRRFTRLPAVFENRDFVLYALTPAPDRK